MPVTFEPLRFAAALDALGPVELLGADRQRILHVAARNRRLLRAHRAVHVRPVQQAHLDAIDLQLAGRTVDERLHDVGHLVVAGPRCAVRFGVLQNTGIPRQRIASG